MSDVATANFAQSAAHNILFASFFKGQERVASVTTGNHLGVISVESGKNGESRGYATDPDPLLLRGSDETEGGVLKVLRYLTNTSVPYTSTIPFQGGVENAWQMFYEKSEMANVLTRVEARTSQKDGSVEWVGGLQIATVAEDGGVGGDADVATHSGPAYLEALRESWKLGVTSIESVAGDPDEELGVELFGAVTSLVAEPLGLDVARDTAQFCQQDYFCPCGLRNHAAFIFETVGANECLKLINDPETISQGGVYLECQMCNARNLAPIEMLRSKC
jgi:hypothetical protein